MDGFTVPPSPALPTEKKKAFGRLGNPKTLPRTVFVKSVNISAYSTPVRQNFGDWGIGVSYVQVAAVPHTFLPRDTIVSLPGTGRGVVENMM